MDFCAAALRPPKHFIKLIETTSEGQIYTTLVGILESTIPMLDFS
jgi:hypothetical protein